MFHNNLLESTVILFYGSPLSGKGIQSKILSEKLKIPVVSSGDILRSLNNEKLNIYINSGELVPNELLEDIFINEFSKSKYSNGFILDGFVREKDNIYLLNNILVNLNLKLTCVVNLTCSKDILIERLQNRKKTESRKDDDEFTFEKRYRIFNDNNNDIDNYYTDRDEMIKFDSNIENVSELILLKIKDKLVKTVIVDLFKLNEIFEYILEDSFTDKNIEDFLNISLKLNIKNRTGQLRRIIFVRTTNKQKFNEFKQEFDKYGIEVIILTPKLSVEKFSVLFGLQHKFLKIMAIFEEETLLLKHCYNNIEDYKKVNIKHKNKAVNYSKLKVYTFNNFIEYENKISGYIDMTKKTKYQNDIFGWDDIFVMENNGFTFNELKKINMKLSSRNMNISKWMKDNIYYNKLIDLKFTPINSQKVVNFDIDVFDFIKSHKYFNNELSKKCGLYNMFINIINNGVYFKCANNRRIKNYWYPGLNGGIPMVPKNDEIHECTYMAHDFGHFGIPDLIYIGNSSNLHKKTYVCWRMLSEALTMCLADMLFVDTLVKTNVEYDYSKRKIYDLFKDLKINLKYDNKEEYISNLKKIIFANYRFCLFGDDLPYINLLNQSGSSLESLNKFKEKYIPFFVSDYKWTIFNFNNMLSRSDEIRLWYSSFKNIKRDIKDVYSIDDIINLLDLEEGDEMYDKIFNYIFDHIIIHLFNDNPILDKSIRDTKTFKKYGLGQSAIFFKYYFLEESKDYIHKSKQILEKNIIYLEDILEFKKLYKEFLEILLNKNLISQDDLETYQEIFPLFNQMYLSYDVDIEDTIQNVYKEILEDKDESNLMEKLVIFCGGNVDEHLFVTKPGIIILSELNIEHPNNLITFLISGCSIEASMELIAHKEAKVARLTTSKTNAMNKPLYRIYNNLHGVLIDTRFQKNLIKEIIEIRDEFQIENEILNTNNISSKCTALCYSMTLEDLNKLFIGRSGFDGNESEVRNIIKIMTKLLHQKYPNLIKSNNEYLNMKNSDKYSEVNITTELGLANTIITSKGQKLFKMLNICSELPDYLQLAEFRSRITYLTFLKKMKNYEESLKYCFKIINEYSHLSVLSAYQICKFGKIESLKEIYENYLKTKEEKYNIFKFDFK